MRWRGRRQSSNIEDRRGGRRSGVGQRRITRRANPFGRNGIRLPRSRGARRASGGGLGTIILLIIAFFVLKSFGIDLSQIMSGAGSTMPQFEQSGERIGGQVQTGAPSSHSDDMTQFIATILAETEDVWNGIMESEGIAYRDPTLVLFSDQVRSACGAASSATGPFYCPADSKVYIDLTFYDELARKFSAAGDFAQAYVLAHEVGHHVQNVIGVLPKFNQMRRQLSKVDENRMSVRVELQADCFAGIWAHYTAQKGLLERGDLEEALNAATQIGDDTLQKRSQGFIVPESFNHGTSEQRRNWFLRGFEAGRLRDCDTFNNPV